MCNPLPNKAACEPWMAELAIQQAKLGPAFKPHALPKSELDKAVTRFQMNLDAARELITRQRQPEA